MKKPSSSSLIFLLLFVLFSCLGISVADSNNVFDTCPTATNKSEFINGFPCKNPTIVTTSDFNSAKLTGPVDTDDQFISSVNILTAAEFSGLNTLGLSISRTDLGTDAIVSPHSHPRATEIFFVNQGIVLAGFLDTKNRLFQSFLKAGDVMVFPKGLLHFCLNSGYEPAIIFSVFNSQNPGVVNINGAMFEPADSNHLVHKFLERLKSLSSLSSLKFNPNVTLTTYISL
ncbi:germin-like protein subfamily 3 member 4 [Momordica charantia]|uniref:Germin-like protein n=1 Tax=Momordica charantia TaxID=3673 RepID=A0A6J1DJ19_MOMCH|nr:germin-like protein subfamily 3 member 4 [Momordica charantia]